MYSLNMFHLEVVNKNRAKTSFMSPFGMSIKLECVDTFLTFVCVFSRVLSA